MARKLLLANMLMLAVLILLGFWLISSWQHFQRENSAVDLLADASGSTPDLPDYQPADDRFGEYTDYSVVVERNLFSEDRQPPSPDDGPADESNPPPLAREPLLHGSAVIGGRAIAFVTKFDSRSPQGVRMEVSEGDDFDGWTVHEIRPNSMTLKWKEQTLTVNRTTSAAPQQRAAASSGGGVRIVTVGSRSTAVETTTASTDAQEEQSGLQVASVGGAAAQRGARGQRNTQGAQGARQNLNNRGNVNSRLGNRRGTATSNRQPQRGTPPRPPR